MKLYVDGGCLGNGQKDMSQRRMVSIVTDEKGEVLARETEMGGSNNIAELKAVVLALRWALQYPPDKTLEILSDSTLMRSWAWEMKKPGKAINDRNIVLELQGQIHECSEKALWKLTIIRREDNVAGHVLEHAGQRAFIKDLRIFRHI